MTDIESRLRYLRTRRQATQAQVAARLGINQPALSRLESRSDVSLSMLRSFIEALGGQLRITAEFADEAYDLSGVGTSDTVTDLRALVNRVCCIHPMPAERARDEFLVRTVDELLITFEKLSNHQILEVPVRRVSEVLPKTSSTLPTIVLRGSLQWSANEKLWRMVL